MAPLWLSLKLAVFTTLILALVGVVSGYVLHMFSFRGKSLIRAIIALPLVLPPTVLGDYLLVAMQPDSFAGGVFEKLFGVRMVFSFYGILLGSIVFSLPFMVSPILSGLDALPKSIAIFHEMEAMNYDVANQYALVLLVFSLVIIFLVQWLQKRIALW